MQSRDLYAPGSNAGWLPWGALAPVLCLVMVVITQLAGSLLLEPFVNLDAAGNPTDPPGLMAFTIVPFGLLLLLLLAWVRFVERRGADSIGLTGVRRVPAFSQGWVIGLLSMTLIVAAIRLAGGFTASSHGRAWSSPRDLLIILLLLPSIALQSSVEEILFRGWLLSVLSKKFNVVTGVVVSSALFGLLHFSRGQHLLATLSNVLFGVFCCCWALRSRSVLGVMGWHAGWNWILAVGFGLPLSGLDVGIPSLLFGLEPAGPHWLHGGAQGPEASVICVLYFLAGSAWLLRLITTRADRVAVRSSRNPPPDAAY